MWSPCSSARLLSALASWSGRSAPFRTGLTGSILGATLGAFCMAEFGPNALFRYIAGIYLMFAAVCLYRVMMRGQPRARREAPGLAHPAMTPDAR